eukprot:3506464-Pleurochrysis_carterae.AAC.1
MPMTCSFIAYEITELKGITELGKKYFHDDGFTLAVDLAIAKAITTAHVSRNQVPALFLIFARFFQIMTSCQPIAARCRTRSSTAR